MADPCYAGRAIPGLPLQGLALGEVLDDMEAVGRAGAPQMNFRSARNAAALAPPSPSSLTTTPAARGGRAAKSATSVAEPPRPTASGDTPRSASVSVCTGFFFAAM